MTGDGRFGLKHAEEVRKGRVILTVHVAIIGSALMAARAAGQDYRPQSGTPATRSDMFIPAASFLLPGLGQWIGGDYGHASVYSGIAVSGAVFAKDARSDLGKVEDGSDQILSKGIAERKYLLGLQSYQAMGGFSLFHSFRTSVTLRQEEGAYSFLGVAERPIDLALAPFNFTYLSRATTWVPLGLGVLLNSWYATHPEAGWHKEKLTAPDYVFASAFSWNAGTHEEAVFRGWLMPVFREYWMSDGWSNAVQASVFAAAHLTSTDVPVAQLLLGWHLGNVVQANQWTLGESIFIHTWWDVAAFLAAYTVRKDDPNAAPARLHLPPLTYSF